MHGRYEIDVRHFGGPAAVSSSPVTGISQRARLGFRPEALRPILSDGLPLSMTPRVFKEYVKRQSKQTASWRFEMEAIVAI